MFIPLFKHSSLSQSVQIYLAVGGMGERFTFGLPLWTLIMDQPKVGGVAGLTFLFVIRIHVYCWMNSFNRALYQHIKR